MNHKTQVANEDCKCWPYKSRSRDAIGIGGSDRLVFGNLLVVEQLRGG